MSEKVIVEIPNEYREEFKQLLSENSELSFKEVPMQRNALDPGVAAACTFVITNFVFPVVSNVVSNAVYDYLKSLVKNGKKVKIDGKDIEI